MAKKRVLVVGFIALIWLLLPLSAYAQTYSFSVDKMDVHVFWNEDGTISIDYIFVFTNDTFASPIDFVDVGLPNSNYDLNSISADVNGNPISLSHIAESPYVEDGVEIGLGSNAIQSGESGQVHVYIGRVGQVLYRDDQDDNYVSGVFSPTWFDNEFVHGNTDISVTFHLPPGVQPEEPRWHQPPAGFPSEPATGFDEEGRITYTWQNPNANAYTQFMFGASFPQQYVPESAVVRPNPFAFLSNISLDNLLPFLCGGFFVLSWIWGLISNRRRKMKYLPPKVAIEGHGIKRGLTAIEAAILMEQPMDKILTLILFAVIKKNAAQVVSRDPLEIKPLKPTPDNLRQYELDFLDAFEEKSDREKRRALLKMMVDLVKSVSKKMKGFSRRETIEYYRDIIDKAWSQVEAADTPEVKAEKYDEVMEWTMLDREYEDRTRDIFRSGPVFVPVWWHRYDPGYSPASSARPSGVPKSVPSSAPGGGTSMPTLPGSAFAASVVSGAQNFSSGVIGSISDFTSGVTRVTNPPPKSTGSSSRSSGGGSSCACACACACAGCACACAGGGR
jgi:hypothetical protein